MKTVLTLIFYIFFSIKIFAQLHADFSSNVASGCSPLIVHFTNTSTGNYTSSQWYFGNGNSSQSNNPSASYVISGQYTVKLVISNGTQKDSVIKTNYIAVFGNPFSNFTATTALSGCAPLLVSFASQCVPADGPITTYIWDFGDGSQGNSQNINHTYIAGGDYPVSLQIKDANGCESTKLINNYVHVSPKPVVLFSANPNASCTAPLTVQFSNQSTGTGALTYQWNFGDGTTSAQASPSHEYISQGTYNVSLTVTDQNGCQTVLNKLSFIQIIPTNADFDILNTDTICLGEPLILDNHSMGAYSFSWTFGDGNTSGVFNPTHVYETPGLYTIKLVASGGVNCSDSIARNIFVEAVSADFTMPAFSCDYPVTISLINASQNNVINYWYNNGAYFSGLQNPQITFIDSGIYQITLITTSPHGCADSISKMHEVKKPKLYFTYQNENFCPPVLIHFQAHVSYSTNQDQVESFLWNFGDAGTTSVLNPDHTYMNPGEYPVSLTITTDSGCTFSYYDTIHVGFLPVDISHTRSADTACAYPGISFFDTSVDPNILETGWSFSDSTIAFGDNVSHAFYGIGWIYYDHSVSIYGCALSESDSVFVLGPYIRFLRYANCDTPLVYFIDGDIRGATKWYWNFNDGSPVDSVHVDFYHEFSASGDYMLILTSYNDTNQCAYVDSVPVYARNLQANFFITPESYGCPGDMFVFHPDSTIDETSWSPMPQSVTFHKYYWNFDVNASMAESDSIIEHSYNAPGDYYVKLFVSDMNGCLDTAIQHVKIYKPDADFMVNDSTGCGNFTAQFTDLTQTDTTLSSWYWSFGNGTYSDEQHPLASYNSTGNFTVNMIVSDILGCSDTINKLNYIHSSSPNAIFFAQTETLKCSEDSVKFHSGSTGLGISYLWDFGDSTSSSIAHPWHTFQQGGVFDVSLTVTDVNGCSSTYVIEDMVRVEQKPDVDFIADTVIAYCYPLQVSFTDLSGSPDANYWHWNFGDGATSPFQNPVHNYTLPGIYNVSLLVSTPGGCSDSLIKNTYIRIMGPYANFEHQPDTICKGETISFLMTQAQNVANYHWDFGDGAFGSGVFTNHTYYFTGTLFPRLLYSDSSNTCQKYKQDTIFIYQVIANFNCSDTATCAPQTITFTNLSQGASEYYWNFGDATGNATGMLTSQVHNYPDAGTYLISLRVNSFIGCRDTVYKQINIFPNPVATAYHDTLICRGDSTQLNAFGGEAYLWTPASG
ncbi:MAG: hypothetical protein A2275_04670, partial [Bacteroidetes bacterium RIFOXYA12_FULL_35_11]